MNYINNAPAGSCWYTKNFFGGEDYTLVMAPAGEDEEGDRYYQSLHISFDKLGQASITESMTTQLIEGLQEIKIQLFEEVLRDAQRRILKNFTTFTGQLAFRNANPEQDAFRPEEGHIHYQ